MRKIVFLPLVLALVVTTHAEQELRTEETKNAAVSSIDRQAETLVGLSDQVWGFAEIALEESRSAALLADHAEAAGFRVQRGVAGMPTAFIAEYGQGKPIIGILGEFDALPRLSQVSATEQKALVDGAAGHGCGHNLFGTASLGAAIAVKELLASGALNGTLRFYGTPAEEAISGKTYMARAGLFDDLDVALSWHPNDKLEIDLSGSQAMFETVVEFSGKSSHAAADPWNGRSALDGLELFTHSINLLREHVKPTVRMHYTYLDGGGAPNVVPSSASVALWIRDTDMQSVLALYERVQKMVQGAALAADVSAELKLISGVYSMLQNRATAKLAHANMQILGGVEFDATDHRFAKSLQTNMGVAPVGMDGSVQPLNLAPTEMTGGSTDVADVSWIVPTVDINVVTAPIDIPWHSWGVVASSGSTIGHKGMQYAAKVIAMTAIDLYSSPDALRAIAAEFNAARSDFEYKAYVPEGPPPIPITIDE